VSFAEELELLPSYMVYLAGCNLRCSFCLQREECISGGGRGEEVRPARFARDLERIVRRGARTINLAGGEPSLHLHTILQIAAGAGRPLPLVLNSNMYMTPEALELLDGVVEVYLADFKFGNDRCAAAIAGAGRYVDVVRRNLLAAAARGRLLVRHLLLPGHVECCFVPIARWMAAHLPSAPLHVMDGFVPSWRGGDGLDRLVSIREISLARRWVEDLGLVRYAG
jgi:putative pyruvate formate lyase activating enzyme